MSYRCPTCNQPVSLPLPLPDQPIIVEVIDVQPKCRRPRITQVRLPEEDPWIDLGGEA